MISRTARIIILVAIVLVSLTASLMIQRHIQAQLRQTDDKLRDQAEQFAELLAEQQRLSNSLAEAAKAPREDPVAELARLRAEAEALRKQTNELRRQTAERSQSTTEPGLSRGITPARHGAIFVVSDAESEDYTLQLSRMAAGESNRYSGDAKNLSFAVLEYAREHDWEIPATFAEAEPYKWKSKLPRAGTMKDRDTMAGVADFEIVYHGSLNEIANIPRQSVAMIRQREPWPTPRGKWARIYTMADGRVFVVESADDFQSWEAHHIIPSRAAE